MARVSCPCGLAVFAVGVSCIWFSPVHGAEQRTVCPRQLAANTFTAVKAPTGWIGLMPTDVRLVAAGMLDGAPNESGYLVPFDTKGQKKGKVSTWFQRWVFTPPSPNTWLYCGYGGGGMPLQLSKKIPEDARQCTATSTSIDRTVDQIVFICH